MTWIQIFRQNRNGFLSNISHQMIIKQNPIDSRLKRKWYKSQKTKNFLLNLHSQSLVQILILCLSYFITTVTKLTCSRMEAIWIMYWCVMHMQLIQGLMQTANWKRDSRPIFLLLNLHDSIRHYGPALYYVRT